MSKTSNRRLGLVFGVAIAASSLGAAWSAALPDAHQPVAQGCTTFSKYAGKVPCNGNVPVDHRVRNATVMVIVGCGTSLAAGPGAPLGCAGTIAGQVGWFLPK